MTEELPKRYDPAAIAWFWHLAREGELDAEHPAPSLKTAAVDQLMADYARE